MFSGGVGEWSLNQISLVNWLRFYYHRVYSNLEEERPPDDLVEYDILLDDWLEAKDSAEKAERRKRDRESGKEHQKFSIAG
jgi:hypothetical protein